MVRNLKKSKIFNRISTKKMIFPLFRANQTPRTLLIPDYQKSSPYNLRCLNHLDQPFSMIISCKPLLPKPTQMTSDFQINQLYSFWGIIKKYSIRGIPISHNSMALNLMRYQPQAFLISFEIKRNRFHLQRVTPLTMEPLPLRMLVKGLTIRP